MAANLFVFLFSCILAGLLYYFRVRRATTKAELGKLALALVFIGIFLLVNTLFAYLGRSALLTAIETPPILSMEDLQDVETGGPVVLYGIISPLNPIRVANYVTYIECDDDSCTRDMPSKLLIALDGGDAVISNNDFEDHVWPVSSDGVRFLARSEPVIIVGTMERGVVILGPDKGKQTSSVYAEIIFAGSHEDFVASARGKMVFPIVMFIANLVAFAVVVILPWVDWYLRSEGVTAD